MMHRRLPTAGIEVAPHYHQVPVMLNKHGSGCLTGGLPAAHHDTEAYFAPWLTQSLYGVTINSGRFRSSSVNVRSYRNRSSVACCYDELIAGCLGESKPSQFKRGPRNGNSREAVENHIIVVFVRMSISNAKDANADRTVKQFLALRRGLLLTQSKVAAVRR